MAFVVAVFATLFIGVQVMFEIREDEKRRGINLRCWVLQKCIFILSDLENDSGWLGKHNKIIRLWKYWCVPGFPESLFRPLWMQPAAEVDHRTVVPWLLFFYTLYRWKCESRREILVLTGKVFAPSLIHEGQFVDGRPVYLNFPKICRT